MYNHFQKLGDNPDVETVILLIYANCLIKFFNLTVKDIKSRDSMKNVCQFSQVICSKILNEFTVSTGKVRLVTLHL